MLSGRPERSRLYTTAWPLRSPSLQDGSRQWFDRDGYPPNAYSVACFVAGDSLTKCDMDHGTSSKTRNGNDEIHDP